MVSMKYPFPLVILMWVYLLLPFLLLNELCISAVIRDLSRLCGIDVYKVEKSFTWTDVAVRIDIQLVQEWQQACGVFNNSHAVDSIAAGFSVIVPN